MNLFHHIKKPLQSKESKGTKLVCERRIVIKKKNNTNYICQFDIVKQLIISSFFNLVSLSFARQTVRGGRST